MQIEKNSRKHTLLLVEDEALIALAQERLLTSLGYSVIRAPSGEKALEIAGEHQEIDLVLMDIDLGRGMDGTEAAKAILELRELPIVFLTSHSEKSMVDKVKDITRYGYVLKSSGEFVLAETIEMAFDLFASHRSLQVENEQHRKTREILAENTVFLESTFEAIQDGVSVLDTDLAVRHVNGIMEKWYPRQLPLEGKKCYEVYHDRSTPCDNCPTIRSIETGAVERSIVPGAAGSPVKWIELFAFPMKEAETGAVTGVVEYVRDITDREESAQRLRASERRSEERRRYLEALLGAAPVAVVTLEPGNRVVEWNREAEELFGYTGEEARGRELDELVARESETVRQDARDNTRRVISGEVLEQVEGIRYRKDGSPVHVVVSAARIDMDGEAIGAVVTYKDISRRKAAEAALQRERDEVRQLLEQQKLLVKEVHHRIKNDMAFVRSLLSLQSHRAGSKDVADSLREASDRVSVMSRVYERMYLAMDFRNVDGKALIEGLVEDLRASSIPPGVAISVESEEFSLPARQSVSLGIILNELVSNSVKYAFHGEDSHRVEVTLCRVEDHMVRLSVRDNGDGLPEQVLGGEEKGYGLTIVAALVEQHDGTLQMQNDGGAVVSVLFSGVEG